MFHAVATRLAHAAPLAVRQLYQLLPARIGLAGTGSERATSRQFRPGVATEQREFGSIGSMKLGTTESEQPSLKSCCQGAGRKGERAKVPKVVGKSGAAGVD